MDIPSRWLACAAGAGLLAATPASAQFANDQPLNAVLPASGITAPAGLLREQLDRQAPGGGPAGGPGRRLTPARGGLRGGAR